MATAQPLEIGDLFDAIKDKNIQDIDIILDIIDINQSEDGITPLWVAITGCTNVKNKANRNGSYKMVEYLLNKGADPNKACITVPPIYISILEKDLDITSLLLNQGAYVNGYKVDGVVEINKDPKKCACKCKLALIYAIDNHNSGAVEILLTFGAVFNKETIKRANKMVINATTRYREMDHNDNIKYLDLIDAKKIVKILETQYHEIISEENTQKFIDSNKISYNSLETFFIGLQTLKKN